MTRASEIKPNLFVIGTFKCGTTSLHQYLSQHPEVFMPRMKETRYFAFNESASCSDEKYLDKTQYPIRSQKQYLSMFEAQDASKQLVKCHLSTWIASVSRRESRHLILRPR
jgi:hypothetical protein